MASGGERVNESEISPAGTPLERAAHRAGRNNKSQAPLKRLHLSPLPGDGAWAPNVGGGINTGSGAGALH